MTGSQQDKMARPSGQRHTPGVVVDLEVIRRHYNEAQWSRAALGSVSVGSAVWILAADVPVLLAEIERLDVLLALTRLAYANLLAAARATLTAHADGEADFLDYLRDELTGAGEVPHRPDRQVR